MRILWVGDHGLTNITGAAAEEAVARMLQKGIYDPVENNCQDFVRSIEKKLKCTEKPRLKRYVLRNKIQFLG